MSKKYWVNNLGGKPYYVESDKQPGADYIQVSAPRPQRTPDGAYSWINGEWQLPGFIDQNGNYHLGDMSIGDQVVPRRPTHYHTWTGTEWVFDNSKSLEEIRWQRNGLLAESDYVDLPNTPLDPVVKAQWITYRQQLRDFPETCDPVNPVWPVKPDYIKA